jgi:hypothetical protein|eukprot:CAMPEP_0174308488 /NCGR_PEP_ID=MMETSP0810-20121108/1791_1 /TAXON_ID=73025 ORGANISM="Eutreptiella gymnastica-like, Strain CCMP1594" /NCGR_SAMPLE_ID=MMETSP0810 /ASSEMBLY_ACC=CAM_ASM_000659 /LENGTH=80 /DNA_ID=CAMNT_0015415833 /DNA_START=636 /DNA_END=878 /DNA_ORIENTATION=+
MSKNDHASPAFLTLTVKCVVQIAGVVAVKSLQGTFHTHPAAGVDDGAWCPVLDADVEKASMAICVAYHWAAICSPTGFTG